MGGGEGTHIQWVGLWVCSCSSVGPAATAHEVWEQRELTPFWLFPSSPGMLLLLFGALQASKFRGLLLGLGMWVPPHHCPPGLSRVPEGKLGPGGRVMCGWKATKGLLVQPPGLLC